MEVARSVDDLRLWLAAAARSDTVVGLFPTMGALHDGHLSLVRRMVDECEVGVVSVFVNPLQFGPEEDYQAYPRDLDRDLGLLAGEGVDIVFAPETADFLPAGSATMVHVGGLTDQLEGASRPGHFDGVATIVTKLLHAAGPDRAYFSEKDFQQLVVIRRMVADLNMPVRVVDCPFVREPDGLAMSSRNAYLSADERAQALALSQSLAMVEKSWEGDADRARADLRDLLAAAPGVRVEYAEIADPDTLTPLTGRTSGPARALVAAHVGPARLIDNLGLPARG